MGLFDFFKKKQQILKGEEIVAQLTEMGYFKYTHPSQIDELKKEIAEGLSKHRFLFPIEEKESPYNSKDFRHFPLDGEDLYEQGGIIDKLKEMETLFEKMNLNITITHHFEDWDEANDWLNHTITINDKEYVVFKNFKNIGWGEAAQKFADILNDQLKIQGKDERIYLINGGNDGRLVFLTEEQFKLLDPIFESKVDRPLDVEQWCKVMQVTPV